MSTDAHRESSAWTDTFARFATVPSSPVTSAATRSPFVSQPRAATPESTARSLERSTVPEQLSCCPGDWWVLHTRSRNEKRVAAALAERDVPHYLPLLTVERRYTKSRFEFEIPVFPCYLFVRGDHDACDVALRTNRVANVIHAFDQRQLESELIQIARAIASHKSIDLFAGIQVGKRYRVARGPLRDVCGVVLGKGRQRRMYLSVTMLGQSIVVEVDVALLEPES